MAQLSRLKKNQELREKIDLETVITNPNEIPASTQSVNTSVHAKKNVHPHKQSNSTNQPAASTSPVIDDLLAEVKKYNMENGDRVSTDTQINILQSLDTSDETPTLRRNNHILPMEEEEEKLGSTMKLPRTSLESLQQTTDLFRFSKLTKINRVAPLVDDENEEDDVISVSKESPIQEVVQEETKEEDGSEISSVLVKPARIEFSEPVIIDSSDLVESFAEDLEGDDDFEDDMEDDHLEILEFVLDRSNEVPVDDSKSDTIEIENNIVEKKPKKKFSFFKKKNKKEKIEEEEEVVEFSGTTIQEEEEEQEPTLPEVMMEELSEEPKEETVSEEKEEVEITEPVVEETKIEEETVSIMKEDSGEDDNEIIMIREDLESTEFEDEEEVESKSNVLNIILVILLLALLACAAYIFFIVMNLGK